MKINLFALTALFAPIFAQNTLPTPPIPPTPTVTNFNGPPWASDDPAKWSSIYNSLVSAGYIPSTLTAVPWPTGTWGPGSGPWGPGHNGPGGGGGGPGRWGGPNGPFGPSHLPPSWSTRSDWASAPWTLWWNSDACPASDWPGWTAGPWSTSPPWTTWSGCQARTTATEVQTITVSGQAVVTTAFGLQVAAASAVGTDVAGTGERVGVKGVEAVVGAVVVGVVMGM